MRGVATDIDFINITRDALEGVVLYNDYKQSVTNLQIRTGQARISIKAECAKISAYSLNLRVARACLFSLYPLLKNANNIL